MSTPDENTFSSYNFDADEYHLAATYTELQRQHIQNQLSMYALQKMHISAEDYPEPEVFIRNHEYHRGLIDGMRFLLELDNSLKGAAIERMKDAELRQHLEEGGSEQ